MKIEVGKNYKHDKRNLYVMAVEKDPLDFIIIQYSDGRIGKLIQDAPGWKEINDKEWLKVIEKHRKEKKEE